MTLKEFFEENKKAAIGFSGGVDSAYLLYAAKKYKADIQPYFVKTAFQPQFEYDDALMLCDKLGIELKTIEYDILSESVIKANPCNRCYYCKRSIFNLLKAQSRADGYSLIIDGTNASDNLNERPGAKAIEELGVRSPLRECGLTKDRIRELSKNAGLFTWNKPSYSCLATRTQNGTELTYEILTKIENAELELMKLGFRDFRVRVYNSDARLQIKAEQFAKAVELREKIVEVLKPYFDIILLDMEAR